MGLHLRDEKCTPKGSSAVRFRTALSTCCSHPEQHAKLRSSMLETNPGIEPVLLCSSCQVPTRRFGRSYPCPSCGLEFEHCRRGKSRATVTRLKSCMSCRVTSNIGFITSVCVRFQRAMIIALQTRNRERPQHSQDRVETTGPLQVTLSGLSIPADIWLHERPPVPPSTPNCLKASAKFHTCS